VVAPSGPLRVSRYFIALAAIVAVLYALVFFTGSTRTPRLGLDLQGGTTVTLKAVTKGNKAPRKDQLGEARTIIERRVNGLGVSEAEVVTQGSDQITVSLPGRTSRDIRKEVAGTARLAFRQVISQAPGGAPTPPASPAPSGSPVASPSAGPRISPKPSSSTKKRALTSALLAASPSPTPKSTPKPTPTGSAKSPAATATPSPAQSQKPLTDKALGDLLAKQPAEALFGNQRVTCTVLAKRPPGSTDDPKKKQVACDNSGTIKYLLDVAKVQGTDVGNANYEVDTTGGGGFKVTLSFKGKGQDRWTKLTQDAFGKQSPNDQVAIVLDGVVVSAPQIRGVITGNAEITGNFSLTQAKLLANQLKYGALPLTFTIISAQTVSPTLGTDQLKAGLLAGGIGLALVVVYSFLYYRALGLVTIASLVLSGVITYGCVVLLGRQIGFTLTLAGIAGFIVAVGITADSFVVFFERLKDEVKDGRSVRSAVPRAWVRARRTILSADAVSFLAAAALYLFTVGAVRGFAFTLGLSTILDILVVFLFTHPLVHVLSQSPAFDSPRITGLGNVRHRDPASATPALAGLGRSAITPKES